MRRMQMRGVILAGLLVVMAGCSSETAQKPEVAASARPSTSASTPPANKSTAASKQQTSTGSSLDALRAGKSPAEGPMKAIFFDFDSYALSSDSRALLKANADWLKANLTANVEVEGHCDERGTTEYNLALGAKRARAAMDYLVTLGVAPARIKTISYGEELPQCREAAEDCYRRNRRDRFVEVRARPGN